MIEKEIPVISDVSKLIGGPPITFLTAIQLLGEGGETAVKVLKILNSVDDFIQQTSGLGANLKLNFGDLKIRSGRAQPSARST